MRHALRSEWPFIIIIIIAVHATTHTGQVQVQYTPVVKKQ